MSRNQNSAASGANVDASIARLISTENHTIKVLIEAKTRQTKKKNPHE